MKSPKLKTLVELVTALSSVDAQINDLESLKGQSAGSLETLRASIHELRDKVRAAGMDDEEGGRRIQKLLSAVEGALSSITRAAKYVEVAQHMDCLNRHLDRMADIDVLSQMIALVRSVEDDQNLTASQRLAAKQTRMEHELYLRFVNESKMLRGQRLSSFEDDVTVVMQKIADGGSA